MEKKKCLLLNKIRDCFTYSCNLQTGAIEVDDNFYEAFKLDSALTNIKELQSLLNKKKLQDENVILEAISKVIDEHQGKVIEVLYAFDDRYTKRLKISLCPFINKEQYVEEIYGVIEDISDLPESVKDNEECIK